MTDRPRGDALDQELRSATRAIVSPTPPPPDFDELAMGLSDRHAGEVRRARVLVFAVVVIAVIGGVVAFVIAATGGDDAGIVVTDAGQDALDREGVSVRDLMWVEVPLDDPTFGSSAELIAVAASESMVVVGGSVGDDAALWTSADRTTWTRVPHDEEVFGGAGEAKVTAITLWRSGFIAAGEIRGGDPAGNDEQARSLDPLTVAAVWISEDGITWERIPHDEEVFGGYGRQEVFSIAALDDRVVIVGFDEEDAPDTNNDIAVWTSSDGRQWRQEPSFGGEFGGGEMFDVVATTDGFVGVGAAVWTSPDGTVWERVAEFGAGYMTDVETVPEGFIAVGGNGAGTSTIVWAATEASSWTRASQLAVPTTYRSAAAVAAGDSGLVAISGDGGFDGAGGSQIFVSTDGTSWESAASLGLLSESAVASLAAEYRVGHAVAGFGPNFLAVGRVPSGGSAMWTTQGRTDPGSPENEADTASVATSSPEETVSAGDVYLAPGETLLRINPVVVQGSPGPEPRFDTGPLGEEISLEPVTELDSLLRWAVSVGSGLADDGTAGEIVRITLVGQAGDGGSLVVVYSDTVGTGEGLRRWRCVALLGEDGGGMSGCGPYSPEEYRDQPGGLPRWIPGSLPDVSILSHGNLNFELADETSVVSVVIGDRSLWQRPVGGFATFPVKIEGNQRYDVTAFDSDGNIIGQETYNDPANRFQYPKAGPGADPVGAYPQTGPDQ